MGIQSIVSFAILLCIDYKIFPKIQGLFCHGFQINHQNYAHLENNNTENPTNSVISSIVPVSNRAQIENITTENPTTCVVPILTVCRIEDIAEQDNDVVEEAERILSTPNHVLMQTDVLVLNQVAKIYHGSFFAVDGLSVGVKRRECFGLLGVNGA
jgi:hypothetical protein